MFRSTLHHLSLSPPSLSMSSHPLKKPEPLVCTPASIPSTLELPDEDYISLQGACKKKVLPRSIEVEGGIFTTVCCESLFFSCSLWVDPELTGYEPLRSSYQTIVFKVKRGQGDKVVSPPFPRARAQRTDHLPPPPSLSQVEQFRKVHKETDEVGSSSIPTSFFLAD